MANDVPAGIEIEPVFVIEATYAPDARETRPRVRPQHLARIADLMAKGVVKPCHIVRLYEGVCAPRIERTAMSRKGAMVNAGSTPTARHITTSSSISV